KLIMKTLFTLDYKNYDTSWTHSKRDSARGIIVFSDKTQLPFAATDKIALVFAKNDGYFKFPGGGIHKDENITDALIREVSEETGLSVIPESVVEYGVVPRFQRSNYLPDTIFDQESFYYFCKVCDGTHRQNLDAYEAEAGFELKVVTIEEAIRVNMNYKTDDFFNLAMITRDTNVLQGLVGQTVEPSRATAEFLLEESAKLNPGPWKFHSQAVANAAEKIADAVAANGGNMDPDKAYVYGLLHDIGRRFGHTYIAHVIDGYEYLSSMGFEDAGRICITHSFNLHTVDDYIGKIDVFPERFEKIKTLLAARDFSDYDRLIQLLDSTCAADGTQNLEIRMTDVKNRYGYYPQGKWDKNFELKAYFEKLMGRDFYQVIK
ncbi:MAG: NUDIX domain-containing protein, partial [Treponemataceae bacterium]|nr:NUDIX domain-containing protein [Treponemataceae bacterium]